MALKMSAHSYVYVQVEPDEQVGKFNWEVFIYMT